jgi:hypothetical protein
MHGAGHQPGLRHYVANPKHLSFLRSDMVRNKGMGCATEQAVTSGYSVSWCGFGSYVQTIRGEVAGKERSSNRWHQGRRLNVLKKCAGICEYTPRAAGM